MQVIKDQNISFIDVDSIEVGFYYLFKKYNQIGIITREQYSTGDFITLCINSEQFTNGDRWGYREKNLKSLICILLDNEFEVYCFRTPKELAEKLAELIK